MLENPENVKTGADILLEFNESVRRQEVISDEDARIISQLIIDMLVLSPEISQYRSNLNAARIAQKPLLPEEQAPIGIVGMALQYARDEGVDEQTWTEILRLGMQIIIRYSEYRSALYLA